MKSFLNDLFGHPVVGVMCFVFLGTIALVLLLGIFTNVEIVTLEAISLGGTMLGLCYGAVGVVVYEWKDRRR